MLKLCNFVFSNSWMFIMFTMWSKHFNWSQLELKLKCWNVLNLQFVSFHESCDLEHFPIHSHLKFAQSTSFFFPLGRFLNLLYFWFFKIVCLLCLEAMNISISLCSQVTLASRETMCEACVKMWNHCWKASSQWSDQRYGTITSQF
jgi:hypothetical protein